MSGNKTHDFNTNYQLNNVSLVRALAKVQLNVKLSVQHYSIPVVDGKAQYSYKYIDFDKNTYVFKPSTKTDNLVSSNDWTAWSATGSVSSYTLDQGNVTNLTLTTYINERDNASSAIEIKLPYQATAHYLLLNLVMKHINCYCHPRLSVITGMYMMWKFKI
jgi:hypothetical protein